MKSLLKLIATAALCSISLPASAQQWLKDRQGTQGPGLRWGDLEVHPGAAAEFGYDSNYFARPTNLPGYPVVDVFRLRFTPQISLSTLSAERMENAGSPPAVTFSVGGALAWSEFLTNTDRLGRNREISATADGNVVFAPGRPISFTIRDSFTRTPQPSLGPDSTTGLDRIENHADAALAYNRSGGLLSWTLGYGLNIVHFDNDSASTLNNLRHEITTTGRWRFFPRTAFIFDGSVWFYQWLNPSPGLLTSRPVRVRFGLSGLLTERFSVTALVGWGAGFYDIPTKVAAKDAQDFDSIIGQVELRYFLTGTGPDPSVSPNSSVAVGVTRDFQNGYLAYVQGVTKIYASANAMLFQKLYLSASLAYLYLENSAILNRTAGTLEVNHFNDGRIEANAYAEYRIQNWLGLNASFSYSQQISDTQIPITQVTGYTGANTIPSVTLAYSRYQLLGGVRVFF